MAEESDEATKTAETGTEESGAAMKADEKGDNTNPATPSSGSPAPVDSKAILEAVKERLRFFFSDANVRQDTFIRKYLLVKRQGDDDSDKTKAAVPVEVLLRFNTIKQHTDSPAIVVQAAKELDSTLTVHGDDGDKAALIGRVDPFTESKMKENIPHTLYLSNLPVEKNRYKHSADDIRKLFGDKAATIVLVKFQHRSTSGKQRDGDHDEDDDPLEWSSTPTQKGKKGRAAVGACLVEFESLPALEAAAAHTLTSKDDGETLQPSHVLKLGEHHIVEVQLFQDYLQRRKQMQKKRKQADLHVQDDDPNADEGGKKFHIDWKPGCVIQITGIASGCDRETILADVAKELDMTREKLIEDKVVYADYSRGQSTGALRFQEPTDAIAKLCEKLNSGEATIAGEKVETAVLLAGEEEEKYWQDFIELKNKHMNQRMNEKNSKRKKGRRS